MPVPGASALTAFLSASGLPTDRFTFLGFPPKKAGRRGALFTAYADRPETLVFYESPHRIQGAMQQALAIFGDRLCALGREMTKTHEEFLFGTLSAVLAELESRVVEIAGDGLRQVKDRAMKLPQVQSAAQQGLQLRVLLRPGTKDATHYLREHLGDDGLSFAIAKPSLEDVFVASTNGGGRE